MSQEQILQEIQGVSCAYGKSINCMNKLNNGNGSWANVFNDLQSCLSCFEFGYNFN